MTTAQEARDRSEAIRALDHEPATWDRLKPGVRVHYNSGHGLTSWTAEVRSAPIDEDVVVVRRTAVNGGRYPIYVCITRLEVQLWTRPMQGVPAPFRLGSAPRELAEALL